MKLEFSLLTEALFAVLANVATSLMNFSNVTPDVSGTLELLVALRTRISFSDVFGFVMQFPGASIHEFGQAQSASESALLMDDFSMPRQHDLRREESSRGAIGALVSQSLVVTLPVLPHRAHRVLLSTIGTWLGNLFLAQMNHSNMRVEHRFSGKGLLTSDAELRR